VLSAFVWVRDVWMLGCTLGLQQGQFLAISAGGREGLGKASKRLTFTETQTRIWVSCSSVWSPYLLKFGELEKAGSVFLLSTVVNSHFSIA